MNWARSLASVAYWRSAFSIKRAVASLLASFGTLWLAVETTSFFSVTAAVRLKELWLPFLIGGLLWAAWENRPQHRVSFRLGGRDVGIEIRVADLFDLPGALVVGTNRSFDTDIQTGLISARSVQGAFTNRFYDSVSHLDHEIELALAEAPFELASDSKKGKKRLYPIGTCVKLHSRGRDSYWTAIATMNDHGTASSSLDDLRNSLPRLWEFVATRGDCGALVVPVLGSGYSRLPQTREEIVREIIQSFVAACASQRFCDSLTIAIPVRDYYDNEMNLAQLGSYLEHVCKYTSLKQTTSTGAGSPVS
jgi:hypothetical protein